jgi:hypothetical protein
MGIKGAAACCRWGTKGRQQLLFVTMGFGKADIPLSAGEEERSGK